jgi:hypothetical protein
VTAELARREVLVDYRPQAGIRIAPHFYTSDEELEHTIGEIKGITAKGTDRSVHAPKAGLGQSGQSPSE